MEDIKFRPAEKEDCKILWQWRNDKTTRKYSFNPGYVPYEEHQKWFEKSLKNKNRHILIALHNGIKVGMIRFDVEGAEAEISINVSPEFREKGIGNATLKKACEYVFNNLNAKKLSANIKKDNTASIKIFKLNGFRVVESNESLKMILNKLR